MALRAMCKYYRVTYALPLYREFNWSDNRSCRGHWLLSPQYPMWMLLSLYGAGMGCISVEPPSVLKRSAATLEPVVTDSWFVSACTDNSSSSCFDMSSHILLQLRWSLVLSTLYRHFPRWEALLWAILARAHVAYPSKWAACIFDNLAYLPSQMATSFIGISNGG